MERAKDLYRALAAAPELGLMELERQVGSVGRKRAKPSP